MNRQIDRSSWSSWALLLATAASHPACGGDDASDLVVDGGPVGMNAGGGEGGVDGSVPLFGDMWALTSNNQVLRLRSNGAIFRTVDAPLPSGETARAADTRVNGVIYVLTSTETPPAFSLRTLEPLTGTYGPKVTLTADAADTSDPFTALTGESFGVDFSPVTDELRIVSSSGQNLAVNPETGAVVTDTPLAAGTVVTAAAYTNNWPRTTPVDPPAPCGTFLYVIDSTRSTLLLKPPADDWPLTEIANFSLQSSGPTIHVFDILTDREGANVGWLVASEPAGEVIYELDLKLGSALQHGTVSGQGSIVALLGQPLAAQRGEKAGEFVATTASEDVVTFNHFAPGTLCTRFPIRGLAATEEVLGGDVRPNGKAFYVLTRDHQNAGRLRRLDVLTGVLEDGVSLAPAGQDPYAGLFEDDYGVDFDPGADLLSVVSGRGRANLRVNPSSGQVVTGTSITDPTLAPQTGRRITEIAHDNGSGLSEPNISQRTTLWAIDAHESLLGRVGDPPSAGVFRTAAPLGLSVYAPSGGDMEPVTDRMWLALGVGDTPQAAAVNTTLFGLYGWAPTKLRSYGKIGPTGEPVTSLSFRFTR